MATDHPICLCTAYIEYLPPIALSLNQSKVLKGAYPLQKVMESARVTSSELDDGGGDILWERKLERKEGRLWEKNKYRKESKYVKPKKSTQ